MPPLFIFFFSVRYEKCIDTGYPLIKLTTFFLFKNEEERKEKSNVIKDGKLCC